MKSAYTNQYGNALNVCEAVNKTRKLFYFSNGSIGWCDLRMDREAFGSKPLSNIPVREVLDRHRWDRSSSSVWDFHAKVSDRNVINFF